MPNHHFPNTGSVSLDRALARIFRSPLKRLRQGIKWVAHYPAYLGLKRDIEASGLSQIASDFPEYRFKFLGNYLSPAFSVSQRAAVLGQTYRFLASQRILPFRSVLAGGWVKIWSRNVDGECFDIILAPMEDAFLEGDLALVFRCNQQLLYRMTFSFLTGSFVGLEDPLALFIGGSQGYKGMLAESRRVSKVFGEICPATLLLIMARAIAKSLGLRSIVGISLAHHSCDTITSGKVQPMLAYDSFWEMNGAEMRDGFYHMTSDLVFRPSEAASSSHRARARRKQERKMRLYAEMLACFGFTTSRNFIPARTTFQSVALLPV